MDVVGTRGPLIFLRGEALALMFSMHPEGTRFPNNVSKDVLKHLRESRD